MENQTEYQVEKRNPEQLIALALERGADPGTLEKLMDLQERWEAGQARKAYVSAMTGFKQEAPAVLIKGDKVDFSTAKGRTHYNYANLGSIVQEITSILGKYELSASWETAQDDKYNIIVTCHITHVGGHRESVTLRGPADESGNKNQIQAVGSTVTYLQRYTLLAALGLATGEDDDGRQGAPSGKPPITQPQRASEKKNGQSPSPDDGKKITENQGKRFFAIASGAKKSKEEIESFLYVQIGSTHTKDIPVSKYDLLCELVKTWKPGDVPQEDNAGFQPEDRMEG
ncbi:MAG: ERF family protein [Nitrospiria bacterium]